MYNPLLGNLTELKDSEVEAKINDLSHKYTIAARTGMNDVLPQIIGAIDAYREELQRRQTAALAAVNKNQNKDLGNLIKVN